MVFLRRFGLLLSSSGAILLLVGIICGTAFQAVYDRPERLAVSCGWKVGRACQGVLLLAVGARISEKQSARTEKQA